MICYLAKGDVALSITLTLCSTLLAVVAMPTLTWWYLGERIPVPVWGMLFTVLKIVIAPVCPSYIHCGDLSPERTPFTSH